MNVMAVYRELLQQFGPQQWWPVHKGKRRPGFDPVFEIMLGCILTQNTAWKNVALAIENLHEAGCLDPRSIAALRLDRLKKLITPSGYFNQKAKKVKILARHIIDRYDGDATKMITAITREDLLLLWGIGPETADSMLCYAGRRLEFVVDVYTKRLCERYGVSFENYQGYKDFFEAKLPEDYGVYREYHALIVRWGQEKESKPKRGTRQLI